MLRIKIARRSVAVLKGVLDGGWDGSANGANGDLGHSASARPAVNIQKVILQWSRVIYQEKNWLRISKEMARNSRCSVWLAYDENDRAAAMCYQTILRKISKALMRCIFGYNYLTWEWARLISSSRLCWPMRQASDRFLTLFGPGKMELWVRIFEIWIQQYNIRLRWKVNPRAQMKKMEKHTGWKVITASILWWKCFQ